MSQWILVIMLYAYSNNVTVESVNFATQQDCLEAAKTLSIAAKEMARSGQFMCVRQGVKP